MIFHKIPKPITLIGEMSNKCISYASCNFTYINKFKNKSRYLINKNVKDFYKKYLKNYEKIKSNIIKIETSSEFASSYSSLFGNLNLTSVFNKEWFNIRLKYNKEFFDNLLVFHIKRKFYKYEISNSINSLNLDVVNKMVDDAYKAYDENNFKFFGTLIDSFFRLKIKSNPIIMNQYLYNLYSSCRLAGAWGGKMDENTMILLAPKEKHENILEVMKENIKLKSSLNTTGIITEELFSGNSNCCK